MEVLNEIRKLRRMKIEELRARYRKIFGENPPKRRGQGWLWKRVAWKLQADAAGEPVTVVTKPTKKKPALRRKTQKPDLPLPGTTLVRNWRGRDLELRVLEDGFLLDGVKYRTLTAAAEAITGAHWSGALFFGLRKRNEGKEMTTSTKRRPPRPETAVKRVGIYTRKSTEDGLDQEFNSLDAQRDSVEAYIQSHQAEGWVALPERYDDGGFTGANTDRPAFKMLLQEHRGRED